MDHLKGAGHQYAIHKRSLRIFCVPVLVFSLHRVCDGISCLNLAYVTGLMAQLFSRMKLILAITSLLPYGLHAIWLNMEPIEKKMMQSVNLFTDKF